MRDRKWHNSSSRDIDDKELLLVALLMLYQFIATVVTLSVWWVYLPWRTWDKADKSIRSPWTTGTLCQGKHCSVEPGRQRGEAAARIRLENYKKYFWWKSIWKGKRKNLLKNQADYEFKCLANIFIHFTYFPPLVAFVHLISMFWFNFHSIIFSKQKKIEFLYPKPVHGIGAP